jgi:uncharacterized membrane protein YeaQ/YmgE (transglycosylase-associated protein family)
MASRAGLIMSQIRGQIAQIYRENPDDGGTLTDVTAGLMGARTAYEGIKAYQNVRGDFEKQFQTGKFADGNSFIERGAQRLGERMFGPYSAEGGALYYSELAKKDPSVKDVMSFYDPDTGQKKEIDLTKPLFEKAPERPMTEEQIKLPAGAGLTGGRSGDNIHTNYGTGTVKEGSAEHRALLKKKEGIDSELLPDMELIGENAKPIAQFSDGKLVYSQEEMDEYTKGFTQLGVNQPLLNELKNKFYQGTQKTTINSTGQTVMSQYYNPNLLDKY